MTLLETERLIRKLSELLQQGGNLDSAPKLAGDYAAACHAVNLRLQQCEAMLKAGDRHQALQLAETAPNLLDLITLLEFRGADDWRTFCQQNALPVAERIEARSVQALNSCYAQGITTDHPLYAAYRKAVLNRNDEEALKTLQSITRLNSADENAAAELTRLDAKVLAARLKNLGDALTGGDAAMVVGAVEAIEAFGFKTSPEREVWRNAQTVRCGCLLEEAERARTAARWAEALGKCDFIRRLENDFKLELPSATVKPLANVELWARGEQEKDRKDREFRALLGQLHFGVQQSAEKDTSARYVNLPELRDDFESLNKTWRLLADFTRPIPEEAAAAFRKRSSLLETEIARRTAIRRRTILAGATATLIVGAVIVWFILGQVRTREFATALQTAVSQRQVRAAEHLLDRVRTGEKRLSSAGSTTAAVGAAETFVTKEHALLANFEAAFGKLPTHLDGEPDAAKMNANADQLAQTRAALNELAPDLKAENEPRVQAFEKQWQQFLAEGGTVVNGLLAQWVGSAEAICAALDYRAPVETTTAQIATLSGIIQKINDCEAGFTNQVSLRGDLLQRGTIVRAKCAAYHAELKKLDKGMTALKTAHTFAEFTSAIRLLASSEFSAAPAVTAATAIQALGTSDEAALRALLGVTNAATWAFIRKGKPVGIVPEIAMPAECTFIQELNADPAVNARHQHYRLWLDREETKSVEWITAGLLDSSQGWKAIKAWTPSPTANSAGFEEQPYGCFDGQWKLSAAQPIYRLELVAEMKEATAFGEVGLNKVWSGGSTYNGSLLGVLDAVKNSRDGSPMFRAYLLCRLVELMEFQPDAWGLSFCPAARAHTAQIRMLVGGEIASGDWFIPTKAGNWNEKLERFFTAEKSLSYVKQASGNMALEKAVATDGLQYVGFVGLDGKPVITASPPPTEMWAYEPTRRPVLFTGSAMPLSPLFALAAARSEYLVKAGVVADEPSFGSVLPALFRTGAKP